MTLGQLIIGGAAAGALLQTLLVLPRLRGLSNRDWTALAINWATPPLLYLVFLIVPSVGAVTIF